MLKSFRDIQVFLKFNNFYRRFIFRYSTIVLSLTNLLKEIKTRIKKRTFESDNKMITTFNQLRDVFQRAFILVHFDFLLLIRLKIDVLNFNITSIFLQLQSDEIWRFTAFYSQKQISIERNYEIHDQKLLVIVICFKHWRHYLKNSHHFVKILTDHNNLKEFMKIQILNERQIKWIMKLAIYDFEIKHQSEKINFVDASSRRFDYKNVNTKVHRLLFTLQHKLVMLKDVIKNATIINAIYVKSMRSLFFIEAINEIIFSKFQSTCAKNNLSAVAVMHKNLNTEFAKNAIENNIFIFSDESVLFERAIMINNREKQYVSRVIVATLTIDEKIMKNNFMNILKFNKILQIFDESVQLRIKAVLTTSKREQNVSKQV